MITQDSCYSYAKQPTLMYQRIFMRATQSVYEPASVKNSIRSIEYAWSNSFSFSIVSFTQFKYVVH